MAQFGFHALVGLWIAWQLPMFSPYVLRFSFGAGIFLGCIFPDMDIYAEAVGYFVDSNFAPHLHRTLTHSVITATALLLFFVLLEKLVHKKQRQLYDIEANNLDDEALLALSGALATQDKTPSIDFRAFGTGLFAGMLIHIMLDVVFWFTPVDLLFPLTSLGLTNEVNAWKYDPPNIARTILTVSESLLCAVFFTALRWSVAKKLGKWTQVYPDELVKRRKSFSDTDIEHSSMDFSIHAQDDICPLDQKTLSQARPALAVSKFLIIFQYLYFLAMCGMAASIQSESERNKLIFYAVFGELLIVCVPAYFYLSWALRDVIMRKTDL